MVRTRSLFVLLAILSSWALGHSALAQPPVIGAGECLDLVGAPPGAPAAETEERVASSEVLGGCRLLPQVDLNRDGENMIQAWILPFVGLGPPEARCELHARVGHSFSVDSDAPPHTRAWVTLQGELVGHLISPAVFYDPSVASLSVALVEHGPAGDVRLATETAWSAERP